MEEEVKRMILNKFLAFYKGIVKNSSTNFSNIDINNINTFMIITPNDIDNDDENKYITISTITKINNIPSGKSTDSRIINKELIIPAINIIRDDFINNHKEVWALISPDTRIQILQNNNFILKIIINNNEELEEAKKYNRIINCNPNRFDNNGLTKTRVNK